MNLHQLVAPKTRPPPCLIRNRSPFKIESYSFPPIPPAREKQQSLYSSKRLVRSEPWQATPSQGLGPLGLRPPVMRTRATHTVRCANRPGRPRDETRFKQHPPNGNPTRRRGHPDATTAVVLRSVLQNCRGVPFKGPRSLGGSRLKGPSKNRGVQGGRGAAGGR